MVDMFLNSFLIYTFLLSLLYILPETYPFSEDTLLSSRFPTVWNLLIASPWCHLISNVYSAIFIKHLLASTIGEGNGNPLQCSCLENPRDGVLKGVKPPVEFGERTRDWTPGHAGKEGPHLEMMVASRGFSRAAPGPL